MEKISGPANEEPSVLGKTKLSWGSALHRGVVGIKAIGVRSQYERYFSAELDFVYESFGYAAGQHAAISARVKSH